MIQKIIVFIVVAVTIALLLRKSYRIIIGKSNSCNCNCNKKDGQCNCCPLTDKKNRSKKSKNVLNVWK